MDRKVDSRAMREVNRSIIYDLIRRSGDISRTELARISSLTKPTVSTIVEHLIEEGIVSEVGFTKSEPTGGRRARLLRFNADSAAYVGLRFGVKSSTVALCDGLGRILSQVSFDAVKGDPEQSVKRAREAFDQVLAQTLVPPEKVQQVGVAIGGLVEAATGNLVLSPNLQFKNVELKKMIEEVFGYPARVFNVTEAAATAEARSGVAARVKDFVWVYVGTGIGAALVNDGQLYRGRSGFAGEIGFCRMSQDGPILEEVASGRAILQTARERLQFEKTQLAPGASIMEVLDLAGAGDPMCSRIVREAGAALGLAVAHLVNITNPEMVVLGGGVAEASPIFVQAVDDAVKQQALGPEVVPAVATGLAGKAVTTGAVLLAMDQAVRSLRITSS